MRAFAQAERFVSEVEARKLRPAYVFVGDEVFFRKQCRDAILRSLVPNDLREGSGGDDNPIPVRESRIEDGEDPAVISFQRNQPAGIENDSVHAAVRGLVPRLRAESIFLAHARSFGLSGPPVFCSASSTIAGRIPRASASARTPVNHSANDGHGS